MLKVFQDIFHTFYYVSLITAAFITIIFWKKVGKAVKYISILILITLISEFVAKYFSFKLKISNNIVYHFFVIIEYGLYCLIFHLNLRSALTTKFLVISLVVLIIGEITNTIFFQPLETTNTNILILEALFLVFFSLLLFKKLSENIEMDSLFPQSVFWFNTGILIYYSFNVLIWGFHSFKVYRLERPPIIIYDINLLLSGLLYLLFSVAIVLDYQSIKRRIK